MDACAIVWVVYQEASAIYKLIHIKNPPHFFSVRWIFPLFLDFVQQVARYGDFFVFVAYILMHEGFLTYQYTLMAQASFACAFWIYANIYFQHKRGRLHYRMGRVHQEANATDKLIHIKNPPHFFQCGGFFLSF